MDLEPNKNLDVELEFNWFTIWKLSHGYIFFHATIMDKIEFTDHWQVCLYFGLWVIKTIRCEHAFLPPPPTILNCFWEISRVFQRFLRRDECISTFLEKTSRIYLRDSEEFIVFGHFHGVKVNPIFVNIQSCPLGMLKDVPRIFQAYFEWILRVFPWCFRESWRVFRGSFKGV